MKKYNISFVLSLLANIGFILLIIADFSLSFRSVYWLQWGLLFNFLKMVYFTSLMFIFYEYVKGVINKSFIGGFILNILGFILYVIYTSSL
ncbi:membrane protein [Brevibacillus laterosporus]|nr:membrane protein [Brevibacillus laterosporus]